MSSSLSNEQISLSSKYQISWQNVSVNSVSLNVLTCGDSNKELVVLLHGFPESAVLSWNHQIGPICDEGYFVVAPDLRGYNTSSKPEGILSYLLDTISKDVDELISHFKKPSAILVGHDWGGVIAWDVAAKYPHRISRLAILNAPTEKAFQKIATIQPMQVVRSYYMLLFQLPVFPELVLSYNNYKTLVGLRTRISLNGTFSHDYNDRSLQAWSEPGALTAMVNYYRGIIPSMIRNLMSDVVKKDKYQMSTLIIWGRKDKALSEELALLSAEDCLNATVKFIDHGSHFVQHDAPEIVTRYLLEFFRK